MILCLLELMTPKVEQNIIKNLISVGRQLMQSAFSLRSHNDKAHDTH
jgi:hypothetical protein